MCATTTHIHITQNRFVRWICMDFRGQGAQTNRVILPLYLSIHLLLHHVTSAFIIQYQKTIFGQKLSASMTFTQNFYNHVISDSAEKMSWILFISSSCSYQPANRSCVYEELPLLHISQIKLQVDRCTSAKCWKQTQQIPMKCCYNALICYSLWFNLKRLTRFRTQPMCVCIHVYILNFNLFAASFEMHRIQFKSQLIHDPHNSRHFIQHILSQFFLYGLINYCEPQIIFITTGGTQPISSSTDTAIRSDIADFLGGTGRKTYRGIWNVSQFYLWFLGPHFQKSNLISVRMRGFWFHSI